MDRTLEQIAEAFSHHRFSETYPFIHDNVRWNLVGAEPIIGKADVVSACEQSSDELAQATTTFNRFRTVISENCVVVDSEAEYVNDVNQASVVASCDIYDFSNGQLAQITSYTIELDD
jgi:hypothetical protein